ncbi:DUF1799 domain-containing protein [Gilliamella sp. CG25]|uniref:DUF1799 domain-containing protein n=1 Tax=unclassified Gilliamella TaxID=2685620 RepID=UPI0039865D7F
MELATALYSSTPSKTELDSFGLSEVDYEDEYIEIWSDNWDAFQLFQAMSTQWRTSMSGILGLDYNCLPWVMQMLDIKGNQKIFNDIRLMESQALTIIHKSK